VANVAPRVLRARHPESASVVRASDPEQSLPQGGIESAVQDVTPRRGVIVDPPASYLVAKDDPERAAIAADAEPELVESESARRLRLSRAARRGILGAPLAFALHRSRDLSGSPVRVAGTPTRVVRLSHCPILTVQRDRQTDGQGRLEADFAYGRAARYQSQTREKPAGSSGFFIRAEEGLEPSTFCMARNGSEATRSAARRQPA